VSCSSSFDCGYKITVVNDYAVIIEELEIAEQKVSDYLLYESLDPDNALEDPELMDESKVTWDSPIAEVFVDCAFETACRSNFQLTDGSCYVSADYDIVNVNNG
jgi:hypothetical protein